MTTLRRPGMNVGGYRLQDLLGVGGAGEVWRAHDLKLDRLVALKFLVDSRSGSHSIRQFLEEGRALARLQHPNIVTILAIGSDQNIPYIVMEYISGYNLSQLIQNGQIRISWAARIAGQVSSALQYLHCQGIVHRDIKPSNILIQETNDNAKLSDFGLATGPGLRSDATLGGAASGTRYYMAPEQYAGGQADPRSDIYSFGVTLYDLFTGKLLYEEDQFCYIPGSAQIVAPMIVRPEIPQKLSSTILEMLRPEPKMRLASLEPLVQVLEEISQTNPLPKGDTLVQRAIDRIEKCAYRDNLTGIAGQSSSGFFDTSLSFLKQDFFRMILFGFLKSRKPLNFIELT